MVPSRSALTCSEPALLASRGDAPRGRREGWRAGCMVQILPHPYRLSWLPPGTARRGAGAITGPVDAAPARQPGAAWVFIYTREAHPGENVPHHDSFGRKLAGAALLREETGIGRDILVDDLAGTVHRGYGLMPNMTWVIGRGGRIAYKAGWT